MSNPRDSHLAQKAALLLAGGFWWRCGSSRLEVQWYFLSDGQSWIWAEPEQNLQCARCGLLTLVDVRRLSMGAFVR